MAGNAVNEITVAIEELNDLLLNNVDDLGELRAFLRADFESFKSNWEQCNRMTKLNNYQELHDKINNELAGQQGVWFYIGYTGSGIGRYLWDKQPINAIFAGLVGNVHKSHTYYIDLQDNAGQNENALIQQFRNGPGSLNIDDGLDNLVGIVYVLVYTNNQ